AREDPTLILRDLPGGACGKLEGQRRRRRRLAVRNVIGAPDERTDKIHGHPFRLELMAVEVNAAAVRLAEIESKTPQQQHTAVGELKLIATGAQLALGRPSARKTRLEQQVPFRAKDVA